MTIKTLIITSALTLSVCLFGTGCSHRDAERTKHAGPVLSQDSGGPAGRGRSWGPATTVRLTEKESEAVHITTALASFRPMSSFLEATGKILAHQFRKAIVSYPFPARIAMIHARPGDWVEPGQPLVTLQSEAVGEAKSGYFKAMADYELAKSSHEREKRLFDRGAGAGKNLQSAEAELKVAAASLEAAEKKLHVLGFTEAQVTEATERHEINAVITLFAPISGKITDNLAALGGMVDQTSEIMTILDPRLLCVDADIYERDIAKMRKGQKVEVTVPAYPGMVFHGILQYVGDVLKDETRTITVRTEVENREQLLKPGMFASLRILVDERSRSLAIPDTAILDDGDDRIVFVKTGGGFRPQIIVAGSKIDGFIEVLSGLKDGDEVVTSGSYQLKSKLYDEILKSSGVH